MVYVEYVLHIGPETQEMIEMHKSAQASGKCHLVVALESVFQLHKPAPGKCPPSSLLSASSDLLHTAHAKCRRVQNNTGKSK